MPHPGSIRLERGFTLKPRDGVDRTAYFFSFSGAMVIDGELPILEGFLDGLRYEILPPLRIGAPSFRATPQFTPFSIEKFFRLPSPLPFPIQIAAFAAVNDADGARVNFWNGPCDEIDAGSPELPADTLVVILHGADSTRHDKLLERRLVRPILEWARAMSDQWWIGRSYEAISGALHFVAPLDERGQTVGAPTPVARMAAAGPRMRPINSEIWTTAADRAASSQMPGERALATDAKYMLCSEEYRSGCVLACGAIEAGRDRLLEERNLRIDSLACSRTDLLQHLTVGFEKAFGRNLEREDPELFAIVKAFWIARGDAAHGRPVKWRVNDRPMDMADVDLAIFVDGLDRIIDWIDGERTNL